jgi:hypothetical protein
MRLRLAPRLVRPPNLRTIPELFTLGAAADAIHPNHLHLPIWPVIALLTGLSCPAGAHSGTVMADTRQTKAQLFEELEARHIRVFGFGQRESSR